MHASISKALSWHTVNLLACLLSCASVYGQSPVITDMERYTIPFKINRMDCDSNVSPGGSGGHQVWMLNNLITKTPRSEWVAATTITSESMKFPTANLVRFVVEGNDTTFSFYNETGTDATMLGVSNNGFNIFYLPGIPSAERPLYYSDFTRLSYNQSTGTSGTHTGEGSIMHTVNGWGTLHLPNGIFQNVLRIKIEIHQLDTLSRTPNLQISERNTTRYLWFSNDYRSPLLSWDSTHLNLGSGNSAISKKVSYLVSEGNPTTVQDVIEPAAGLHAYFAGNELQVQGSFSMYCNYDLNLFTTDGQKVYNATFNGSSSPVFSPAVTLTPGLYLLLVTEQGTYRKRSCKLFKP